MQNLTGQKVKEMLAKDGVDVTSEEVEKILKFMRALADIAVAQYIRGENNNFTTPSNPESC